MEDIRQETTTEGQEDDSNFYSAFCKGDLNYLAFFFGKGVNSLPGKSSNVWCPEQTYIKFLSGEKFLSQMRSICMPQGVGLYSWKQ